MRHSALVLYTAIGHREDVWTNPLYQDILVGAIQWATGQVIAGKLRLAHESERTA